MTWPPKPGELLPRASEAVGVREKLIDYSLDRSHESGGAKARGFERILGITAEEVMYLEAAISAGVAETPINSVRGNLPYGYDCVVTFPLRGRGMKSNRVVRLRTVWQVAHPGSPPRLISAYLRP